MKKILSIILILTLLLTFAVGCSSKSEPVTLRLSVAASLTECIGELKTVYKDKNSNVDLVITLASSGNLQQQIEQGAPTDIFFSAGQKQMKALKEKGLMINEAVINIVENKVVLITPLDGQDISSFEELTSDKITKIGIGDPASVPAGQYADEIFTSLKINDAISSKMVYAKDVKEVLSWVETGNVDAGAVYATDANISPQVKVVATAPNGSLKSPIIYPIGIVKATKVQSEAQKFIDFLSTDEAKEIFIKYGFSPVS